MSKTRDKILERIDRRVRQIVVEGNEYPKYTSRDRVGLHSSQVIALAEIVADLQDQIAELEAKK